MILEQLIASTDILAVGGDLHKDIRQITYDSRQVTPGTLFVAVIGSKTDGHCYIREALDKGAEAIVLQNQDYQSGEYPWIYVANTRKAMADLSCAFYGFPSTRLYMIGVTGTNGKTTTANLITRVLEDAGHQVGLLGTIHNRMGQEILPVHHTTPEAPDLQKILADFLQKGADYTVMEVSSHALDMNRVKGTEYDVAVFTNLTQDHLDYHQTMEHYLAAKGKLFSNLGKNSRKQRRKFAIINIDDPYAQELIEMTSVPVITYGIKKPADVKANKVEVTDRGVNYLLTYTNQEIPVSLNITGFFNVYNSLAAIAVGLVEGIAASEIIRTLEKIPGIPGRFEKVSLGQDFTVIVDYSHTPDSLENCLRTAREFATGKIITVFGCGGDRDRTKRPVMGGIAGRLSDYCIVTSDNPRSEDPEAIIGEILPGLAKVKGELYYRKITDRKAAIFAAIQMAQSRDVVIIAGKGHEDYQIIGDQIIHFDDKEVALEALAVIKKG